MLAATSMSFSSFSSVLNLGRCRPFDEEAHNEAENCFAQIAQIIGECLVDDTYG